MFRDFNLGDFFGGLLIVMLFVLTMLWASYVPAQVGLIVVPIDIEKPFKERSPAEIVIPFKDGNTKAPAAPSVVRCEVRDEVTGTLLGSVVDLVATVPCPPSNFVCGVRVKISSEMNRIVSPALIKKYQNELHTLTCQYWFSDGESVLDGYIKTTFPVMNLAFAPMASTATPTMTSTRTPTNTNTTVPTNTP